MTLRVLHLIYDDIGNPWVAGGGAVRAFEIYRRLTGRVDARIVTGSYPGAARSEVREGVRYDHVGAYRPYALSRLSFGLAASRLLRDESYDAAVVDFSSYTPIVIPLGRPVGLTVHHLTGATAGQRWGKPVSWAIRRFEQSSIRRAGHVAAVSAETLRQVKTHAAPSAKLSIVSNGVADDLFHLQRAPKAYLLYFGRLDIHHKGLDTLLQAYAILARGGAVPELRLAGRGKDADRVRQMARDLGLDNKVCILGAVSDEERRGLLEGAILQVVPSRFEGFGLVAAEAMASGVPLIASRAGALPEVVGDGGVLVPADDPQALANAIHVMLDSPRTREQCAAKARSAARQRFSWTHVAESHLTFIEDIAGPEE